MCVTEKSGYGSVTFFHHASLVGLYEWMIICNGYLYIYIYVYVYGIMGLSPLGEYPKMRNEYSDFRF